MVNFLKSSNSSVVVIQYNRIISCNEAALLLFGCESEEELKCMEVEDLLNHVQAGGTTALEQWLLIVNQVQQDGVYRGAVICRKKNGNPFIADLQILSDETPDGGMVLLTKWGKRDAVKHKLFESDFLESKPSNLNGYAILDVQADGTIINANSKVTSLLKFNKQELLHQNIKNLIKEEFFSDTDHKSIILSFSGENSEMPSFTKEVQLTFLCKDGSSLVSNVSLIPTNLSGNQDLYQIVLKRLYQVDQAEVSSDLLRLELEQLKKENKNLKRVQKELRKNLDRLKLLSEYSPDVIMQFDRFHRHLFVNKQVENYTNFKVDDFIGKTHSEMGFPLDFSQQCEEALNYVFENKKSYSIELDLRNGMWVEWFLIPEFATNGEVNTVISTARDITERKLTEIELHKSEKKFNDAFAVTKLAPWEYEFETDQIILNDKLCVLLGIKPGTVKRLTGLEYVERFVVPEDLGKFQYAIKEALRVRNEDFSEVIDYRVKRADGVIVHILASVRLEVNVDGRVTKAYGTSQDITQLRLTEQELEEYRTSLELLVETRTMELKRSEARLADALKLANLGTWEYDPVLDCFLVGDEVLETFGSTPEIEGGNQISAYRLKEIMYPGDYETYRQAVYRAREADNDFYTDHCELRVVRSDGAIRHIYLSIKLTRNRGQLKYYGTIQDITDIRETENEKDRLSSIINATTDIVGIANVEGQILYLNRAGRDFFGVKEDEIVNKNFRNFQSGKASTTLDKLVMKHADKHGTWNGENIYVRYDGLEVPVSQVIISHKDDSGRIESYSTIIRDISAQKKIEEDLIFKNNELDTFVYRASHDLRGPIATLMGLYNLVQYEVTEEKALELFDMYNSQALRLNTITLTLIELTKIKEREFQRSIVDFRMIVRNVIREMQNMVESKEMLFQHDIEDIQDFVSDQHLLMVIIQNLVENAIKYQRQEVDSFVRIEIKKQPQTDRVVIKVSDNGIGIESSIQNKIYNMFFRGSEKSAGSGLGLYILKNALEKLGGKVNLYSVLYKGTTFKIELPPLK